MKHQLRFLFYAALICSTVSARSESARYSEGLFPRSGLEISCSVSLKNAPVREYQVLIIENDTLYDTVFADLSMPIFIQLDLNKSYVLDFSKPGFLERLVLIETKVPPGITNKRFSYDFEIEMPLQFADTGFYAVQPIARIVYDSAAGNFGYDVEYAKSIGNIPVMVSSPASPSPAGTPDGKRGRKKVARKKM
jgi:hypothetical protein